MFLFSDGYLMQRAARVQGPLCMPGVSNIESTVTFHLHLGLKSNMQSLARAQIAWGQCLKDGASNT